MKRFFTILALAALLFSATALTAAPNPKVRGSVKDTNGEAVGFCNVIFALASDSLNVRGDITNAEGFFDMPVPAGEYRLTVTMMGYEPYHKTVRLGEETDLGTIVLAESAIKMDAAVVTAEMVRRKADGYMFLPAGSAITTGRNSLELLSYAPGVWIDKDRGISINGKSGTRVMVNDRLLTFSGDELNNYLENIDAEQIRSIEVITDPGAQYDANSGGGILKITLKRTMNGGLSGSAGAELRFHEDVFPGRLRPSMNLEYRKDRLSLYTNFSYNRGKSKEEDREYTEYETDDNRIIDSDMDFDWKGDTFSGRIGSVYELTDRQSIGVDFDYTTNTNDQNGLTLGQITSDVYKAGTASKYRSETNSDRYNFSFNYKLKTDQKGSNLMIVADYMYNERDQFENNYTSETPLTRAAAEGNISTDQISKTDYYTARADYKHYLSQKVQLEAGMKYAYTDMDTDIRYTDELGNNPSVTDGNDHYLYREGVLAGYINSAANLGRWNLSAGLRLENTELRPRSYVFPGEAKKQSYTDLFPSARVVYMINPEKGHMLNAGYTRRINRPGFSQLNPFRMQLNNYTYIVGNPDMKPAYLNDYSLTAVAANKYSLTVGLSDTKGAVRQIVTPELDEEGNETGILLYQHRNVDRVQNLYVAINIPIQILPWWRLGLDGVYSYQWNKISEYDINDDMFQGQVKNLFTFPKNWSAEVNYGYVSGFIQGNMQLNHFDALNLSVKKSFFDNKLTASVFVDNVFDNGKYLMTATVSEPGKFRKELSMRNSSNPTRRYGISLRWNFRAGKETRNVQKVIYGNEEERGR